MDPSSQSTDKFWFWGAAVLGFQFWLPFESLWTLDLGLNTVPTFQHGFSSTPLRIVHAKSL